MQVPPILPDMESANDIISIVLRLASAVAILKSVMEHLAQIFRLVCFPVGVGLVAEDEVDSVARLTNSAAPEQRALAGITFVIIRDVVTRFLGKAHVGAVDAAEEADTSEVSAFIKTFPVGVCAEVVWGCALGNRDLRDGSGFA